MITHVPVLVSPSDVRLQTCESVANHPNPMHRQFCTCAYEFLTMVTKGVIYSVYKVVSRPSFSVTRQRKVSGGIGRITMCSSDGYRS